MMQPTIFEKFLLALQNEFDFNRNQISILREIQFEKLDAKDIAKRTRIPLGRIYSFLNTLMRAGLIKKDENRPAQYMLGDTNDRLREFIKFNSDEYLAKENKLRELIEESGQEFVEFITTKEEFNRSLITALTEKGGFNIIEHRSLPYLFYPDTPDAFIEVRERLAEKRPIFGTKGGVEAVILMQAFLNKFRDRECTNYLVEESELQRYLTLVKKQFGKNFYAALRDKIYKDLKQYDVKINLIREATPMYAFFNNKTAIVALKQANITTGFVIKNNNKVIRFYSDLFKQILENSRSKRLLTADVFINKF